MKRERIKHTIIYCILVAVWGLLLALFCTGCTLYESSQEEIIHCPQVRDTVQIPGWEDYPGDKVEY